MKWIKKRQQLLFVAIVLAAVCVLIVIPTSKRPRPGSSASIDPRIDWPPLPSLTLPAKSQQIVSVPTASPVETGSGITDVSSPSPEASATPAVYERGPNLLSVRIFSPTPALLQSIGVVDVSRILAFHPPKMDSKEARAEAITEIQSAIAIRAEAHDLQLIFDSSGETINGVRAVLSAAPPFDLTQEVIQQLGHSPLVQGGN